MTRIPPSLEPLCRAPRTESIPHVLLCNLRQAGEVVVRCSVQRVESVEPERLVIRVTDGTDDRSVSIGEDCLSLFANVHSLSELVEVKGAWDVGRVVGKSSLHVGAAAFGGVASARCSVGGEVALMCLMCICFVCLLCNCSDVYTDPSGQYDSNDAIESVKSPMACNCTLSR